jgi:hypothetical protein
MLTKKKMDVGTIKKRNSGLELLKIIAMLLIIGHHYVIHAGYDIVGDAKSLSLPIVFLQEVGMYGALSCNFFAMITGFFMIYHNEDVKSYISKILRLLLEVYFYAIVIYACVLATGNAQFSVEGLVKSLFPFIWGNWYIIAYLLFILFMPYLNRGLKSLTYKQYRNLLGIMLFLWSVVPTFTNLWDSQWKWSDVDFFVVMYSVGAFIRIHVVDKKKESAVSQSDGGEKKKYITAGVIAWILIVVSVLGIDVLGTILQSNSLLRQGMYFMPIYSVLSVFFTISWFLVFCNFNFSSKIVDFIASSVFGIYLIHENDYIRPWLWSKLSPNVAYSAFPYFHFFVKVLAVFFVCMLIDIVRRYTVGRLEGKIVNRIEKAFFNDKKCN